MKLDDISKIDKELDEAKKDIQDRIADKRLSQWILNVRKGDKNWKKS